MSYILDALKESQKTRDDRRVPDLNATQREPDPTESRRVPISVILGGVLLIVVGASSGWWYGSQPAEEEIDPIASTGIVNDSEQHSGSPSLVDVRDQDQASFVPESDTSSHTETVEEKSEALSGTPGDEASSNSTFEEVVVEKPDRETSNAKATVAEKIEEKAPVERSVTQSSEVAEVSESVSSVASREATTNDPTASQDLQISETAQVTADTKDPDEEEKEVVPEEPKETVPHFRELPYDIQQELPDISYSVHLYSPNPQSRMVKINGRVRREGSEVFPGVLLHEITPNGAIFVYRDYKFRVPAH